MLRVRTLFAILGITTPVVLLLALATGSVAIPFTDLLAVITLQDGGINQRLILDLRWPRTASAFATGGLLALAGTLMQVLLRNPLADPYILGVSGGAAAGVLLSLLAGMSGLWLTGSAFVGALLSMFIVFGIAHGRGSWTPVRLLLTGVVVAFAWGALISFLLAVSPAGNLKGMLFWLMGDLGHSQTAAPGLAALLFGLALCMPLARDLNVMVRGDLSAASLGVSVGRTRLKIYFLASLLTAVAVTLAGSIGFIGLVVPHILRILTGSDHRILLPASVLLGGSLLVVADTLARTLMSPYQLPVGVLTAALGVPLFLYLLRRGST